LGIPLGEVSDRVDRLVAKWNGAQFKDKTVHVNIAMAQMRGKQAREAGAEARLATPIEVPLPDLGKVKAAGVAVGQAATEGIAQGLTKGAAGIQNRARQLGDNMVKATAQAIGAASPARKFVQLGADAVDGLIQGVSRAAGQLTGQMMRIGNQMASGMRTGLLNGLDSLAAEAAAKAQAIVDRIKQTLAITSPSKVMHEVGFNMAEGMRQGLNKGMENVHKDMDEHMKRIRASAGLPTGQAARGRQASRRLVRMTANFATGKEGLGVVRRVAGAGLDPKFINQALAGVTKELGKDAAKKYGAALHQLDVATADDSRHRASAIQAARTQLPGFHPLGFGADVRRHRDDQNQHRIEGRLTITPESHAFIEGILADALSDGRVVDRAMARAVAGRRG